MAAFAYPEESVVVDLAQVSGDAVNTVEEELPSTLDPSSPEALPFLERAETEYYAAESDADAATYRQGLVLDRIRRRKLFRARDYDSFKAYCEVHLGIDVKQAQIQSALARAYTLEQIKQLGVSIARIGLRLLAATPEQDTVNDLFGMELVFADGRKVRFIDATYRQIEDFIRELKLREQSAPTIPDAKLMAVDTLARNLEQAVEVDLSLVVSKPSKDAEAPAGELFFDLKLQRVPLSQAAEIFGQLSAAARQA